MADEKIEGGVAVLCCAVLASSSKPIPPAFHMTSHSAGTAKRCKPNNPLK